MIVQADRGSAARADEFETFGAVVRAYLGHRSPQVMAIGLTLAVALRILAGGFGWADVAVAAVTLGLTGTVEWVIHRVLLHAPDDSFRTTKLGTATSHREHHLDPPNIGWLMLCWKDVVVFLGLLAVWNLTWPIALAVALGAPIVPTYLSAVLGAYVMLAHYEWTHLLAHTKYRPPIGYYRRLKTNHRLHHYRNEHYWLGVTSNSGDRMLGTLPAGKSDVPLSDTARTL